MLSTVPPSAAYASTFQVTAPDAVRVSAIRLGGVTHANNWGQRFLWLPATPNPDGTLRVAAPSDANTATPGFYMIFALNAAGTPSIGEYVRFGP